MDITKQHQEQQEAKRLQSRISSFMGDFQLGTLLNKSGIRKLRGVSPLALFMTIFTLPFGGDNFYRGIVTNTGLPFKKSAAYELLKNPRYNWRKLLYRTCESMHKRSSPQPDRLRTESPPCQKLYNYDPEVD